MEKKSTDGQEQLEDGRLIPKLRRTIRKYKSRIIFILILLLFFLKIYILPDIMLDLIEHELLGAYMIVQGILWVLILLLIILLIISLRKKSTSLRKKSAVDQDELEAERILRKIWLHIGIYLLSAILFFIGWIYGGANSTLDIILSLPCCAILTVIVLFFVEYCAEEFVKEKGDTRGVKIVCVLFFVLAVLAACFFWFNIARNLIASFDSPSIELTHLSAEYHQGDPGSYDEPGTTDEWTLFGVDSDGKEHVFTIDEDEYYRLTKVGKEDYVTSGESYWIIEFDEDVRLICKYLPWGSLVDFETVE